MASEDFSRIRVRDAEENDIPALIAIKGGGSAAIHRDRLREAQEAGFRYIVLMVDQELIGLACLINRRPVTWSDAGDTHHLPQIVDLQIKESHRGQGYGTAFVHNLEHLAATAGYRHLHLSVDPIHNPHAYALYHRLGYRPLQTAPYRKQWEFMDSAGMTHQGEDWVVDMMKDL